MLIQKSTREELLSRELTRLLNRVDARSPSYDTTLQLLVEDIRECGYTLNERLTQKLRETLLLCFYAWSQHTMEKIVELIETGVESGSLPHSSLSELRYWSILRENYKYFNITVEELNILVQKKELEN